VIKKLPERPCALKALAFHGSILGDVPIRLDHVVILLCLVCFNIAYCAKKEIAELSLFSKCIYILSVLS
jgi:hypothetical protein